LAKGKVFYNFQNVWTSLRQFLKNFLHPVFKKRGWQKELATVISGYSTFSTFSLFLATFFHFWKEEKVIEKVAKMAKK
jgi:hypothetical protein